MTILFEGLVEIALGLQCGAQLAIGGRHLVARALQAHTHPLARTEDEMA